MTAGVLAIMGSGETAPTMIKPHRQLFDRLGPDPAAAVILDTPYGFQANAAALTLGRYTVPVYEIYKVGADPAWAKGLDLLQSIGPDLAVIPHYDNAEGGTHDTRYCYLGERRLAALEAQMPDTGWVLGVD